MDKKEREPFKIELDWLKDIKPIKLQPGPNHDAIDSGRYIYGVDIASQPYPAAIPLEPYYTNPNIGKFFVKSKKTNNVLSDYFETINEALKYADTIQEETIVDMLT